MKKIIFAAAAVFAFGMTNAQETRFGAKAGLNIASISGASEAKSKIGANVGAFAEIKISDKFAVQPELLFSMQGAKASSSESFGAYTFSVEESTSLSYINIPVMAKYFVTEQLSLQAGPQLGILVSVENKSDTTSNFPGSTPKSTSSTSKDGYNTTDFGLNFGAGYDITEDIFVDFRYNLGLTNLNKNSGTGINDIKNRVISLNFGYKF